MIELVLHSGETRRPDHRVWAMANLTESPNGGGAQVKLSYKIEPAENVELYQQVGSTSSVGERRDGLWRRTCCECFLSRKGRAEYQEWNFSFAGHWAAYEFDTYRAPVKNLTTVAPIIIQSNGQLDVEIGGFAPCELSLTVVVVEKGNNKAPFYWALVHKGEKPDFHIRSSFMLELA